MSCVTSRHHQATQVIKISCGSSCKDTDCHVLKFASFKIQVSSYEELFYVTSRVSTQHVNWCLLPVDGGWRYCFIICIVKFMYSGFDQLTQAQELRARIDFQVVKYSSYHWIKQDLKLSRMVTDILYKFQLEWLKVFSSKNSFLSLYFQDLIQVYFDVSRIPHVMVKYI